MTDKAKAVKQYTQGIGFQDKDQHEDAIDCFKQAIKIDPNYVEAYKHLSESLCQLENYDEAVQSLNEALVKLPNNAQIHFYKGNVLHEELDEYEEAIDCFKQAIKIDPNYLEAYKLLSDSLCELEKYDEAVQSLNEALVQLPNNAEIHFYKGKVLYVDLEQYEEAIDCFKQAIKIDPNYVKAYKYLSNSLCELEQYDEAVQSLNEAFVYLPNNAKIHLYKGNVFYDDLEQYQNAVDCFKQALKIDPKYVKAYKFLCYSLGELEKYDEAIKSLNQALVQLPNNAQIIFYKGNILYDMDKQQNANDCYRLAIKIDPQYKDAYVNLSDSLCELEKYDEAIKLINEAMVQVPDDAEIHFNMGYILGKQEKTWQAIDCFRYALKIDPKYSIAYKNLSDSLCKLERYNEAFILLNQAIFEIPDDASLHNFKGQVLDYQHKTSLAITCYRKAIEMDPDYTIAYTNLSDSLCDLKQFKEASKLLSTVIELDPENAIAYNNKGHVLEKKGKLQKAIEYYEIAIKKDPECDAAYVNLGSALIQLKIYDKAIIALNEAISLNIKKPRPYFLLGCALLCTNEQSLSIIKCFEQAVRCDDHYIAGFAMKAYIETQLERYDQALDSLKKVELLFNDPKISENLGTITLEFIKYSIKHIPGKNQMQKFLGKSEEDFELQMIEICKEMAQQEDLKYTDQNDEIQLLKQQHNKMAQDVQNLKQQEDKNKLDIEKINNEQAEMKKTMNDSGLYDTVKIKAGWDKYEKESPELFEYIKIFYWTLLNYFDGCRVASSGLLEKKLTATANKAVKVAETVNKLGAKLMKDVPVVGTVIYLITKAFQAVIEQIKEQGYENKINAMNKIIMDNYFMVDLHRQIAFAALDIAGKKAANPSITLKKKDGFSLNFGSLSDFAKEQINNIFESAEGGKEIKLYETEGGKQALLDVYKLLIHLTVDNEAIHQNEDKQPLYLIIANSVMQQNVNEQLCQGNLMKNQEVITVKVDSCCQIM